MVVIEDVAMSAVTSELIAGGVLHLLSRGLLLQKLVLSKGSCRGVSLVTADLLLAMYVCRYLDLLYIYISLSNTAIKLLHLSVALAIVLLMRYSPELAANYESDLDTFPRAALIVPCFMLAFLYHKVALLMEICRTASLYLESVVLIPQFVMMYKRKAYDTWLVMFVLLAGGEHVVASVSMAVHWRAALKEDPYSLVSAAVQALVYVAGLLVLLVQRIQLKSQQGANEASEKPAFEEVWEASRFQFQDEEGGGNGQKGNGQTASGGPKA